MKLFIYVLSWLLFCFLWPTNSRRVAATRHSAARLALDVQEVIGNQGDGEKCYDLQPLKNGKPDRDADRAAFDQAVLARDKPLQPLLVKNGKPVYNDEGEWERGKQIGTIKQLALLFFSAHFQSKPDVALDAFDITFHQLHLALRLELNQTRMMDKRQVDLYIKEGQGLTMSFNPPTEEFDKGSLTVPSWSALKTAIHTIPPSNEKSLKTSKARWPSIALISDQIRLRAQKRKQKRQKRNDAILALGLNFGIQKKTDLLDLVLAEKAVHDAAKLVNAIHGTFSKALIALFGLKRSAQFDFELNARCMVLQHFKTSEGMPSGNIQRMHAALGLGGRVATGIAYVVAGVDGSDFIEEFRRFAQQLQVTTWYDGPGNETESEPNSLRLTLPPPASWKALGEEVTQIKAKALTLVGRVKAALRSALTKLQTSAEAIRNAMASRGTALADVVSNAVNTLKELGAQIRDWGKEVLLEPLKKAAAKIQEFYNCIFNKEAAEASRKEALANAEAEAQAVLKELEGKLKEKLGDVEEEILRIEDVE